MQHPALPVAMTAPTPAHPRLTPVADHALLVEFAEAIDDDAHDAVLHLDRVLSARPPQGMAELVPAYVSLLVDFDPLATDHAAVSAAVLAALREPRAGAAAGRAREVLVCHDADLAPDLPEVAARSGHHGGGGRLGNVGRLWGDALVAGDVLAHVVFPMRFRPPWRAPDRCFRIVRR